LFLPADREGMERLGWDAPDIILVTGDAYIDSPYSGTAAIGRWLTDRGLRVAVIPQPSVDGPEDITRLGAPKLFWGVSAGCVDSMVANYSATGKRRRDDDFTPGGVNDRRPDRACIAYTNLVKRHCRGRPVVLGGIEASLRRVAHYDMWSDSVRRSVLFDSKADAITYGMGELANLELARCMQEGRDWRGVRGICHISREPPEGHLEMPSFESVSESRDAFIEAYRIFYENNDPITAKGLYQRHGDRYLVQNPPSRSLTVEELDRLHELPYENRVHPLCSAGGHVRAMDTIKQSITTHRGCYGECNFCAIAVHQGRTVVSRSEDSVVREAERMAADPSFNGIIYDVGGPTANMYGIECAKKTVSGACRDRRCLYPAPCPRLPIDHSRQVRLLERVSSVEGVRRVFVASGIRHDMVVQDEVCGDEYLECLVRDHVSGQLKIAPEHVSEEVLEHMGKPGPEQLLEFKRRFDGCNARLGRRQFLTYYLMAAHPGCRESHMEELSAFARNRLGTNPEQIQIFTPTPSTVSTMMYHTRRDYRNRRDVACEHSVQMKQRQKDIVLKGKGGRRNAREGRKAE